MDLFFISTSFYNARFLKNYPGVIDKISHKYVASYLNMSPVTLSRLINMSDSITDNVELFC